MLFPSVIGTLHRFLENRKNFFHGYGFVLCPGGEDGGGELGERFGADGAAQGEVGARVTGGDELEPRPAGAGRCQSWSRKGYQVRGWGYCGGGLSAW